MNYPERPDMFLQAVLEGFVDGIVVLTDQQEVIYTNKTAQSICARLSKDGSKPLPKEIQRVCEALIESHDRFGDRSITLESEAATQETRFRIRASNFCQQKLSSVPVFC